MIASGAIGKWAQSQYQYKWKVLDMTGQEGGSAENWEWIQ